ncbi:MAG: glycosyltransferase [Chloroflexi bacterium]|nr:glycosyltransferase [Chloroflexota bacterium]
MPPACFFFLSFLLPLTTIAFIAILNALTFPRLKFSQPKETPFVSVLIPVRNEADNIAETVQSLLRQDYPNLEIILLDDHSTDQSVEIANQIAGGHPCFKFIHGETLPAGWLGKPWACQQLSKQSAGDYLLFADADVRWKPNGISFLMAEAQRSRADLLTAWTTQITKTWGERLVVPLIGFAIQAYLPILFVHHLPFKDFAAANGQCLLFRRDAYQAVGGHAANPNSILDDMRLAHAIKQHRLRLRAVEANGFIQTRMYRNWEQTRDGFAKNILAGHGNSILLLSASTMFHWWVFILPPALTLFLLLSSRQQEAIPFGLFSMLGVAIRALTAAVTRQRIRDSIFMPVSVFLITLIAAHSVHWHISGGPYWKGRIIPQ